MLNSSFTVDLFRRLRPRPASCPASPNVVLAVARRRADCKSRRGRAASGTLLIVVTLVVCRVWAQDATPAAPGMRQVRGEHLTLITDVPAQPAVDELPQLFERALPQWCRYFGVDPARVAGWRVTGYLMREESRFRAAGYLTTEVPRFLHGYQRGDAFWFREQPSDYYLRHLMLHEGTHAFMHQVLQRQGPGWYQEGVAELLSTHRWQDGELMLNVIPASKEEVPEWGRIRLIREAVAEGRGLSVAQVMQFQPREFDAVHGYAWSWALAAFLDGHPQWQATYRRWSDPQEGPPDASFNARALAELEAAQGSSPDAAPLRESWELYLHDLDYGHRVAADVVQYQPVQAPQLLSATQGTGWHTTVDSRHGWQATGIFLTGGHAYQVRAEGRLRIRDATPPWLSEAGGITLNYHAGQPLGRLLAAVRPSDLADEPTPLVRPQPIGLQADVRPPRDGQLFLKINEPPGQLADNQGQLVVEVVDRGARSAAEGPPPD